MVLAQAQTKAEWELGIPPEKVELLARLDFPLLIISIAVAIM